jgi:hypothetical protein
MPGIIVHDFASGNTGNRSALGEKDDMEKVGVEITPIMGPSAPSGTTVQIDHRETSGIADLFNI